MHPLQGLPERCDERLAFCMLRRDIHEHAHPPNLIGLLRPRRERPCHDGAADKCNEFPSPHGFARAEDHIGVSKEYHIFGSRIVVRQYPSGRPHVRFGSEADILGGLRDVRFTPKSGHSQST
jgi:hypothetical protein